MRTVAYRTNSGVDRQSIKSKYLTAFWFPLERVLNVFQTFRSLDSALPPPCALLSFYQFSDNIYIGEGDELTSCVDSGPEEKSQNLGSESPVIEEMEENPIFFPFFFFFLLLRSHFLSWNIKDAERVGPTFFFVNKTTNRRDISRTHEINCLHFLFLLQSSPFSENLRERSLSSLIMLFSH